MLEQHLVVLGVVVLGVLRDVAELASDTDPLCDFPPPVGREMFDLGLQPLVTLGSEDHFLHFCLPKKNARRIAAPSRAAMVPVAPDAVKRRKSPASAAIMAVRGRRSPRFLADRDGGA